MALFFDFSNMPQGDQLRAKDAAVDFITKQMTSSDLVAIMAYGNRFDVLEDFTADRDRLLSRLKKMATGEGAGLAEQEVDEGGFPMIDMRDNCNVADGHCVKPALGAPDCGSWRGAK